MRNDRRKKMLFLLGRDPQHPSVAGGDVQGFVWASYMASRGHDVTVICQSHPSLPGKDWIDGVRVLRLGRGLGLAWRAWRWRRKESTVLDLVYEDPIGAGRTPYFSPLWLPRTPVIAVWHQVSKDLLLSLHPRPLALILAFAEKMIARVYRRCWFWVPSEERRQEVIKQLGIPADHIRVVPPTTSIENHVAPRATGRGVLFLGVVRPYKDVLHLLDAFSHVLSEFPDAELVIAGRRNDDAYEAELADSAIRLGIADHYRRVPDVNDADKWALLADAAVLVLPSRLEGFGIVTLEAGAVGTPVIASSGVPLAAVQHGINGLRYDWGDITQMASAIALLLRDEALRSQLSEGAQEHVAGFTVDRVAPGFESVVGAALGCESSDAAPAGDSLAK